MSMLTFMDILKLSYKAISFQFEQSRLNTGIYAVIKTSKGPVRGVKRLTVWGDAYYSFERIPFAKPPIGELRFKAPVPAEPWTDVLDCTSSANTPLQKNALFKKYRGSEDCLYLNVFTRNLNTEKPRPVMVWIYGGGFQIGEATRNMYGPDFFMSKDIVLVTIAYRLGPFGFLSIDDPDVNVPGNAGIKDQILSLKWVQENIAQFGGDVNNVTVFGESAGGASTHICMISEKSKGLIHKGIVMSGSALCPWALPPKNNWAYRLAKILGYHGENNGKDIYKFLAQAKGPRMVVAADKLLQKDEKHRRILFAFGPVIEPYDSEDCILCEEPLEAMKKTWSNQIPMMIGGTSFEGLLFYSEVKRRPATLDEVNNCKNLIPFDLGLNLDSQEAEDFGLKLKKVYFGDGECNLESIMKFLELESYREFWHPIFRTVHSRLQHSTAPTYLYRFDFDSKEGNAIRNLLCGRGLSGACHGDDMCYLYYSLFSHYAQRDTPEYNTTRTMIDIWTKFAETGDPNCDMLGNVKFQPVAKDADLKCLNIAEKPEFIDLPELTKLKIWNSFYPVGKL